MSDGIIATDRRGRIRIVNDMALKMLGMAKEDIIGYYMLSVLVLKMNLNLKKFKRIMIVSY